MKPFQIQQNKILYFACSDVLGLSSMKRIPALENLTTWRFNQLAVVSVMRFCDATFAGSSEDCKNLDLRSEYRKWLMCAGISG